MEYFPLKQVQQQKQVSLSLSPQIPKIYFYSLTLSLSICHENRAYHSILQFLKNTK